MNRLEIFQEVYGKDYVFTETELSRLQQVAELIVRECDQYVAKHWDKNEPWMSPGDLLTHFGIEGE